MDFRIPLDATVEEQRAWQDVFDEIRRIAGSNNWDLRGRRLMNAGDAVLESDYVTLAQLRRLLRQAQGTTGGAIIGDSGGGGGGGGGAAGCSARQPVVDAPDEAATLAILQAYDATVPGLILTSCEEAGGNKDWLIGAVAALQADDPRWGFCGQRGDANDIAEDAVTYYCGDLSSMVVGSNNTFVYDIIASHCPGPSDPDPTPTVNDVSRFACGALVQSI